MGKYRKTAVIMAAVMIICNINFCSGSEIQLGDVNADGVLDANDAAIVLQQVLNPKKGGLYGQPLERAKVLGNDDLTAGDAAAILQKVLNNSYIFPAVEDKMSTGSAVDTTSDAVTETTTESTTIDITTETITENTTEIVTETTTNSNAVYVNGQEYYIGQPESSLPVATRTEKGADGYLWYVYADDYNHYMKIGVVDGLVSNIYTTADSFSVGDYTEGMTVQSNEQTVLLDKNLTLILYGDVTGDGNLYAVTLKNSTYRTTRTFNDETIAAVNNQIFDITNAIRVKYGYAPLYKLDALSDVAQAYAEYMADNSYFSHTDMSGNRVGARLTAEGIKWYQCCENIACGYVTAESVLNDWLNSVGHRANILNSEMEYLGVGTAYNSDDVLESYTRNVQNFCALF